jgi:hypothetical protein
LPIHHLIICHFTLNLDNICFYHFFRPDRFASNIPIAYNISYIVLGTKYHKSKIKSQPIDHTIDQLLHTQHTTNFFQSVNTHHHLIIQPHNNHFQVTMCPYYAYTFTCGHTQCVFANFCTSAQISQRRCTNRSPAATIQASLRMEHECEECVMNAK